MTSRSQRLALWFLSVIICTMFFVKSRVSVQPNGSTALFRSGQVEVKIRLDGDLVTPGIYRLKNGSSLGTVIKMTNSAYHVAHAQEGLLAQELRSGDVVKLNLKDGQHIEITMSRMKAREMMLLRIPLHPDNMDLDDWDALPGIGPGLAKIIIDDRQKYGDFGDVEALQRVPGMGTERIGQIKRYF